MKKRRKIYHLKEKYGIVILKIKNDRKSTW